MRRQPDIADQTASMSKEVAASLLHGEGSCAEGGGRASIDTKPPPLRAVFLLDIAGFTGPMRLQPPSALSPQLRHRLRSLLQFVRRSRYNRNVTDVNSKSEAYLWIS